MGRSIRSDEATARARRTGARRLGPRVVFGAAVLGAFVGIAGLALLLLNPARAEADRVARLSRAVPGEVERRAQGSWVLLEGVLAPGDSDMPHGFLAYSREVFLGDESSGPDRGSPRWGSRGAVTPELRITTGAASVKVLAGAYRLSDPPHTWQTEDEPRYVSLTQTTQRHRGFRAGDRVTVEARVLDASSVEAAVVRAGDVAAYLAAAREDVVAERIVGGVLAALGTAFFGLASIVRRRLAGAPAGVG